MTEMSVEPNSDQINAEDFIGGPQTVTVTGHRKGSTEQPVWFEIAEFPGRTFRPGKTMRRLMVAAWGPNPASYAGRQLTLFLDPEVTFGKSAVGGIRISHMSYIDQPVTAVLSVSRGKRAPFVVQPLRQMPSLETVTGWLQGASTVAELQQAWQAVQKAGWSNDPGLNELKDARKAELSG